MRTILFLLGLMAIMVQSVQAAAIVFDPDELTSAPSSEGWHEKAGAYKDEKYDDYLHQGKVIFRVLQRFRPLLTCLLKQAKSEGLGIKLLDPGMVFFKDAEVIKRKITLGPLCIHSEITVDPESIELVTEPVLIGPDKFYLRGTTKGNCHIEVSKAVYEKLSLVQISAIDQGAMVKINLDKVRKSEHKGQILSDSFSIVPRPTGNDTCAICLDGAKEIMLLPCKHVCLCEKCSKEIDKKCPICKQKITAKKRVYL